jgi:F0F1-type ATP synthase membrane subunit b/b'
MMPTFAEAEPLGGWATLLLQGGAFALLVYIITVMYPRATKDAKEERQNRDQTFAELVKEMHATFEDRNKSMADSIGKSMDSQGQQIVNEIQIQTATMTNGLEKICRADQFKKC